MRQKYEIKRDEAAHKLTIREYAVIDKNLKNVATRNLREMDFFMLHEEVYDNAVIEGAGKSQNQLMHALRTENFFPIEKYALQIADAVMNLYDSGNGQRAELFFDDMIPAQ